MPCFVGEPTEQENLAMREEQLRSIMCYLLKIIEENGLIHKLDQTMFEWWRVHNKYDELMKHTYLSSDEEHLKQQMTALERKTRY